MQGTIRFTAEKASADEAARRHSAACAAMQRYLPHVVAWRCACPGAPLVLTLPEVLSAREVVQRAARARVEVVAHLADEEIDEGLRRLGRCLARDLTLAMRSAASEPSFFGL
jgi:DNA-binding transcriptional MocR family regulator